MQNTTRPESSIESTNIESIDSADLADVNGGCHKRCGGGRSRHGGRGGGWGGMPTMIFNVGGQNGYSAAPAGPGMDPSAMQMPQQQMQPQGGQYPQSGTEVSTTVGYGSPAGQQMSGQQGV